MTIFISTSPDQMLAVCIMTLIMQFVIHFTLIIMRKLLGQVSPLCKLFSINQDPSNQDNHHVATEESGHSSQLVSDDDGSIIFISEYIDLTSDNSNEFHDESTCDNPDFDALDDDETVPLDLPTAAYQVDDINNEVSFSSQDYDYLNMPTQDTEFSSSDDDSGSYSTSE